jgi:hypothetical protein
MNAGLQKNLGESAFRRFLGRGILGFAVGSFADCGSLAHLFADLIFCLVNTFLRPLRPLLAGFNRVVQPVFGAAYQIVSSLVAGLRGKQNSKSRAYSDSYCKY